MSPYHVGPGSTAHGIVRIYEAGSHIPWHKDARYFEERVFGCVLENTLSGAPGLRWRIDGSNQHQRHVVEQVEHSGDVFQFSGPARWQWEHGFDSVWAGGSESQAVDEGRRVSFTLRFYRQDGNRQKIERWRFVGANPLLIYLVLVENAAVMNAKNRKVHMAVELFERVDRRITRPCYPPPISLERFRVAVMKKLSIDGDARDDVGLFVRGTWHPLDTEDAWTRTREDYIRCRSDCPVLWLVFVEAGEQLQRLQTNFVRPVE